MGAKITGLGTSEIRIEGVERLHGATHDVIPDRIEAGTYLCAVGLCGGKVRVQNAAPKNLASLIEPLQKAGVSIEIAQEALRLAAQKLPCKTKFVIANDYELV